MWNVYVMEVEIPITLVIVRLQIIGPVVGTDISSELRRLRN
jgi:hypothetical protein